MDPYALIGMKLPARTNQNIYFRLHWRYATTTGEKIVFLRRLAEHIRKQDWFIVIIELLVVVVGLMLAFQIDRWREAISEKKLEGVYVQRLIDDIESDIPKLEDAIQLADMRKNYAELLMAVAENPELATEQPSSFLVAVDQASFTYSPALRKATFDDLRSTGNMRLIRDQDVKTRLHDYYSFDESQLQYRPLQFSVEFHHFKLANGVRSNQQVRFLQDKWLLVDPAELEEVQNTDPGYPDEIRAAAERLRNNPELVSWLTQLREMQMEQILVHNTRIEFANAALDSLQHYNSRK
jgi:hypothetical protein